MTANPKERQDGQIVEHSQLLVEELEIRSNFDPLQSTNPSVLHRQDQAANFDDSFARIDFLPLDMDPGLDPEILFDSSGPGIAAGQFGTSVVRDSDANITPAEHSVRKEDDESIGSSDLTSPGSASHRFPSPEPSPVLRSRVVTLKIPPQSLASISAPFRANTESPTLQAQIRSPFCPRDSKDIYGLPQAKCSKMTAATRDSNGPASSPTAPTSAPANPNRKKKRSEKNAKEDAEKLSSNSKGKQTATPGGSDDGCS